MTAGALMPASSRQSAAAAHSGVVVDADKGGLRIRTGLAAVDQHDRLTTLQKIRQPAALHRRDKHIAVDELGVHRVQIFILQRGFIVRVAQDHHIAGGAQRGFCCRGNGRHRRIVEVGDSIATMRLDRRRSDWPTGFGRLSEPIQQSLDPRHRLHIGAVGLAIGDARDSRNRNARLAGHGGERNALGQGGLAHGQSPAPEYDRHSILTQKANVCQDGFNQERMARMVHAANAGQPHCVTGRTCNESHAPQGGTVCHGLRRSFGALMAAASAQTVNLRYLCYGDGNECEVSRELLDRFEKANPTIKVTVDKVGFAVIREQLETRLAVVKRRTWRASPTWAASTNISRPAPAHQCGELEANFGSTLPWMRVGNDDKGIYGWMTQLTVTGPFVNKTMFDQAGVKMPAAGATMG